MAPTTRANTRAIRRAPPYILPPPSASLQYLSSTPPSPTPAPQTSLSTLEPDRFYSQPHRQPIASSSSLLSSSAPGPSRPSRHASSSSAVLEELHTLASSFLPWDVFKEREQPHKAEQREMNTLHSFHTTPEPHLEPVALPCDSNGRRIPLEELIEYDEEYMFSDFILCFCSLRTGLHDAAKLFVPQSGEHKGCVCVGCSNWKPGKSSRRYCCTFFINLNALLVKNPDHPLEKYTRRYAPKTPSSTPKKKSARRATSTSASTSISTVANTPESVRTSTSSSSASATSRHVIDAAITQEYAFTHMINSATASTSGSPSTAAATYAGSAVEPDWSFYINRDTQEQLEGIQPGWIDDAKRLWSPPPQGVQAARVHHLPVPTDDETWATISRLFDPEVDGEEYWNVMRILGACRFCGKLMFLCIAKRHTDKCEKRFPFGGPPYTQMRYGTPWPSPDLVAAREAALRPVFPGPSGSLSSPIMSASSSALQGTPLSHISSFEHRDDEDEPQM